MDENPPKESPPAGFNKIDLSQLQGFSFGTQWTQDKGGAQDKRDRTDPRPRPDDRRDRRAFRRPEGGPDAPREDPRKGGAETESGAPPRREYSGERRGRPDLRDTRSGPRAGGERGGYSGGRGAPYDRTPYDSPHYSVTFYPEDASFNALVKTIRASCRTIELFEIARTVLGKPERFTVLLTPKDPSAPQAPFRKGQSPKAAPVAGAPEASAADAPASAAVEPAPAPDPEPQAKPEVQPKPVFYISVPDGLPFESVDAVTAHVLSRHLKLYFDVQEVEVDPPKGSFQVVNRCGVTGELLGPPNYHRYNQIVQQHYAAKGLRMPFEAYRSRIETVREPELINQWLEKMKRITRYTWKVSPQQRRAGPAAGTDAGAESAAPAAAAEAATPPAAAPEAPPAAPQEPPPPSFDSFDEARLHLLSNAKDRVVRTAAHARFHGREADALPQGEVRRAIEGALERQRRFPLDTANALRGRLRREHFTIFKKGAKGISYVCAVKRKFRVPGQTFAESIGNLIAYIEAHPMVRAKELVKRYLGVQEASADPAVKAAEEAIAPPPAAPAESKPEPVAALANVLSVEQREKIARMQGDLVWLVREGYVTEFIDGSLYAPPPMIEARKREVESEEHDPENFPEPAPESPAATEAPPAEEIAAAPENPPAPDQPQAEAPVPVEEAAPVESAPAEPAASVPAQPPPEGVAAAEPPPEPQPPAGPLTSI
ncbi:MAG: hypothetical protein ABSA05_15920 [Opitutaceae bacterium]